MKQAFWLRWALAGLTALLLLRAAQAQPAPNSGSHGPIPAGSEPAVKPSEKPTFRERMDALVTVVPKERTLGFDTPGDFFQDEAGRLTHRGERPSAPLHAFGIEILDPRPVYADPRTKFSLRDIWFASADQGRLFGLVMDGLWMQVGDPATHKAVEARLS